MLVSRQSSTLISIDHQSPPGPPAQPLDRGAGAGTGFLVPNSFQEKSSRKRNRFPSFAGLSLIVEQGFQAATGIYGAQGSAPQPRCPLPRCKECCRSTHPPPASRYRWARRRSNQLRCGCGGAIGWSGFHRPGTAAVGLPGLPSCLADLKWADSPRALAVTAGGMAESVDAADLKSAGRKTVGVQVSLPPSLT
jgi:hypothetical protein